MFSFTARKKLVDVQTYIRRICDQTTPNVILAPSEGPRGENRYNRTIPILLCPWEQDKALHDDCAWGVTKDICDRGVGVVLNQPFHAESVVIGFWLNDIREPWFFIGESQRLAPIGAGFWQIGVALTVFANDDYQRELEPLVALAKRLLPPAGS